MRNETLSRPIFQNYKTTRLNVSLQREFAYRGWEHIARAFRSAIQSESERANETKIKGGRQLFPSIMSRLDFPGNERHPPSGAQLHYIG